MRVGSYRGWPVAVEQTVKGANKQWLAGRARIIHFGSASPHIALNWSREKCQTMSTADRQMPMLRYKMDTNGYKSRRIHIFPGWVPRVSLNMPSPVLPNRGDRVLVQCYSERSQRIWTPSHRPDFGWQSEHVERIPDPSAVLRVTHIYCRGFLCNLRASYNVITLPSERI